MKVVHIHKAVNTYDQKVIELAEILWAKWDAENKIKADKLFGSKKKINQHLKVKSC